MSALLWRFLIAAVVVGIIFLILPPFLRILGLPVGADLMLIFRGVVAGLALLYVIRGPSPPFPG